MNTVDASQRGGWRRAMDSVVERPGRWFLAILLASAMVAGGYMLAQGKVSWRRVSLSEPLAVTEFASARLQTSGDVVLSSFAGRTVGSIILTTEREPVVMEARLLERKMILLRIMEMEPTEEDELRWWGAVGGDKSPADRSTRGLAAQISDDGRWMILPREDMVAIVPLPARDESPPHAEVFGTSGRLQECRFIDNERLLLVYENELEMRDRTGRLLAATAKPPRTLRVVTDNGRVGVVRGGDTFASMVGGWTEILMLDQARLWAAGSAKVLGEIAQVAISRSGTLGVLTDSSTIWRGPPEGVLKRFTGSYSATNNIEFLGGALLLGQDRKVEMVRSDGVIEPLVESVDDRVVRLLDAAELSSGESGVLYQIGLTTYLARFVPWWDWRTPVLVWGGFNVWVGMVGLTGVALVRRRRRRKEKERAEALAREANGADGVSDIKEPEVPAELVEAAAAGECVLYAGSGLSAQAGLPLWPALLREMTEWSERRGIIDARFAQALRAALDEGEMESVGESLMHRLGGEREALLEFLRGRLSQVSALSQAHRVLQNVPFAAVLTTNFDDMLEWTFEEAQPAVFTPQQAEPLLASIASRRFFILKLYGALAQPESVILSATQYQEAVASNRLFSSFMETVFFSRTILFVGCGLEGIEDYLKGISFSGTRPRTHYALVDIEAAGSAWELKASTLERKFGIKVMPYRRTEGHPEVLKFLQDFGRVVRAGRRRSASTTDGLPDVGCARIRKLTLENIGPFEKLDLPLTPGWNVLLGDNGVGKSHVMKALALAICGNEARAYANRLIRVGATRASILLETDRGMTYKTTLLRGGTEAEVISEPGRPLEAEGWLALGFPPLRVFSWERSKGPEARVEGRPCTDDLLPLVEGRPDPRMDKLKQWLVNIDYWIKDARERQQDPGRFERMREDFFRVVGTLATGTDLAFVRMDASGFQVNVSINGVELPLEAVSQGTASIMGWVGILVQRLHELPSSQGEPLERYALVLIDEIDAHMHPAWQQTVVPRLQELFPNVQFVATTHSPLIVGGMPVEQVVRFERDASGVRVKEIDADMMRGRADQLLTGDLFGLSTTLAVDSETKELMKEYEGLLAKAERSPAEQARSEELERRLHEVWPAPGETPLRRRTQQLVETIMAADYSAEKLPELRKTLVAATKPVARSLGWEDTTT